MIVYIITAGFLLFFQNAFSQEDTTEERDNRFFHNIFQQVMDAVVISKKDSVTKATILNTRSEQPYKRYEGKIIRHINIRELGFEKKFTDTSSRITYWGTRILDAMHVTTKQWAIRDNLFITENSRLNGLKLADNERHLRSIEFIQDARIIVSPIRGNKDSVDIIIITKDLFTLTGGVDVRGISRVRIKAAENNLLGMGQRLQLTALIDKRRQPLMGYEFYYKKTSIRNTFIDASIGYTRINTGRSDGWEDENAFFVRLERPLVSQFLRLAGAFEASYNHSDNMYRKPDSLFYDYRYNLYDGWIGYNLGITKFFNQKLKVQDRSFVALRFLRNHFVKTPWQIGDSYNPNYNSKMAVLGSMTLFRQNFIKSNYIYGFGTTEDMPYGFNLALTAGWYKQLDLGRPYAGLDLNHYVATKSGQFVQYFFRTGGFFNKGKMQDVRFMAGGYLFSKLYLYKSWKLREFVRLSYSGLYNRITFDQLRIDNPYGLNSFGSDSALGKHRLSLYAETFMFSKYKLFGFQMAPFIFVNFSLLTPEHKKFMKSDLYSGLGGGIRTRNENLIFGTIELRLIYFPRPGERMNEFKVSFRSNIRFRYNTRYIKAPDIIPVNIDNENFF